MEIPLSDNSNSSQTQAFKNHIQKPESIIVFVFSFAREISLLFKVIAKNVTDVQYYFSRGLQKGSWPHFISFHTKEKSFVKHKY